MVESTFKQVSEVALNMMNAEKAKRGMRVSTSANNDSSLTNIDMSVFSKDELFKFDKIASNEVYEVPMRNSTNIARVVFVVTIDGGIKMFYPTTMRKAVAEAKASPIAGEVAVLTGNTYVANRKDFARDGEATEFYNLCQKFPNDKSLYSALAENGVVVKVADKKIVQGRAFNDPTRVSNQGLLYIEFADEGAERAALIAKLEEEAKKAVAAAMG